MASSYQSKLIKQYEKEGYFVTKIAKTNRNGFPDLMRIKNGVTSFVESKEANDTLKPLQKYIIDELKKAGCDAFCMQDGKGRIY